MQSNSFYARTFALAATLALSVMRCGSFFSPFLSAITWAAFLALLSIPVNAWLRRRIVGKRPVPRQS